MYDRLYNSFAQQQRYRFSAQIPFSNSCFSTPQRESVHCIFSEKQRSRLSTEWTPLNVIPADPPLIIQTTTIYYRHIGQVPNYCGHIPGKMFRFGKTYGADTRDAKRWLRGDFTF